MAPSGKALIAQILHDAPVVSGGPANPLGSAPPDEGVDGAAPWDEGDMADEAGPSDTRPGDARADVVAACAALDHSDTDNATRLIAHFGADLAVLETEGMASADFYVWADTHWNAASGNDAVLRTAQKVGGRIALEADHLALLPVEVALLDKAARLKGKNQDALTDDDKAVLAEAARVPAALAARKTARRKFGVSSKNKARITAMLSLAAPHLTRPADAWNAQAMLVATSRHTLRFSRVPDPECPDPETLRWLGHVEAHDGHDRDHLITKLVPVAYDPEATCPRWDAFLAECLPSEPVQRCVRMFSGLGLTGVALQKVMFHYGKGANGKSVFMETLMRVLGPLAVGLPSASITGDSRASGQQASPDIARLYGARAVRVLELPANEPLKEDLVKTLSGGERMPVRNLFKGFFEFTPVFKAHMSGNDFPRIDGTDLGIWRRLSVVPWTVTIPEERRRELSDVVGEFVAEAPGILNWLCAGVLDFLTHGYVEPAEVRAATKEYRDEMDPIGQFATDCVTAAEGHSVRARTMYQAYVAWSEANAKRPWSENKFGRVMKGKFPRDDKGAVHLYVDCQLHDVPERPANPSES